MGDLILKAAAVFFASMVKFILGPALGLGLKLHFLPTMIATVAGMMTTVIILSYFGQWLLARMTWYKPPADGSRWQRYGLPGIAFFTPLILTPIGGTLLALGTGSSKERIILYMLFSAIFWSIVITGAVYIVGKEVLELLPGFAR